MTDAVVPLASYSYALPSRVLTQARSAELHLATSGGTTPSGAVANPYFFDGFVEQPAVVARALLLLARVARTRFYVPPNTVAAVLRAADPVITSTIDGLRFEAFSVCCGVYARLDIGVNALDVSHIATGVTNVDMNPPLRQALANLRPTEPLLVKVGDEELRISTLDEEVVEESVPLPRRWLKGFGESQMLFAGMSLQQELHGLAVAQFIRALPRASTTKSTMWATSVGRALRLASRPSSGAICIAGPERLRVIEPLARFAIALRAYGPEVESDSLPMPSAWVLDLPGARLTIGLSPEKSRGFSGEGSLLASLASGIEPELIRLVGSMLSFESRIDPIRLTELYGITEADVPALLGTLASFGQLGFDLSTAAYFHRPLPIGEDLMGDLHPRFGDAQKLFEDGRVSVDGSGSYLVRSVDADYRVTLGVTVADDRCACLWYAKYRGTRGPCKHALAARTFARYNREPDRTA
jgi:hypothetical protein